MFNRRSKRVRCVSTSMLAQLDAPSVVRSQCNRQNNQPLRCTWRGSCNKRLHDDRFALSTTLPVLCGGRRCSVSCCAPNRTRCTRASLPQMQSRMATRRRSSACARQSQTRSAQVAEARSVTWREVGLKNDRPFRQSSHTHPSRQWRQGASFFNPAFFDPSFFEPSFIGELFDPGLQFLRIFRLTLGVKNLAHKQRAIYEHQHLDRVGLRRVALTDLGPMTAWFREAAQHPHRRWGSDCAGFL